MSYRDWQLVVIDVVNNCAHEDCDFHNSGFSKVQDMVSNRMLPFLERYRKEVGKPIIFVKIVPWIKEKIATNLVRLYENTPEAEYYSKDVTGFAEEFYLVKPEANDIIFSKNTYSIFNIPQMRLKYGRNFIMTGIYTDGCVLSSVVEGFSQNQNFVILSDLVETTDDYQRQQIQSHLLNYSFPTLYADVITSKEF